MRARTVATGAGVAAAVSLLHVGPGVTWIPAVRERIAPGLTGLGRPGHLALTFDDGPDPAGTPAVLDALDRLGWRASFFMLGEQARAWPEVARAVVAGGHEIALHGGTHRYLFTRSPRDTVADLGHGLDAVQEATGVRPRWFRPPYGVLTTAGLRASRRLELDPVLWSAWGRDWEPGATPAGVLRTLTEGTLDGGTVLLHDSDITSAPGSWRTTVAVLDDLAQHVGRLGLRVGPLGEHVRVR